VKELANAPEAMAELIVDGAARSVDLTPFDPGWLPAARLPRSAPASRQ